MSSEHEEVQETLARYRRFELCTDEGRWEWVPATGENYFSPRWFTLLGLEPDELPHHVDTFAQRVPPADLERLWQAVERHRRGEGLFEVEHRMLHKDGSYRWMRSVGRFSFEGGVERLTGVVSDITERKRMEAVLHEAQRLAGFGAWESDLVSGETWWSDQMYAIAGIEPGTPMTTEDVTAIVHPDDRSAFLAGVLEAQVKGSCVGQYRLVRTDGRCVHVRVLGTISHGADGRPLRLSGACVDVSELVTAAQAIARSLAEKETLLREIHHRVANNLAIVGSLLHFHGNRLESPRDLVVLEELRQRIHAMSLVHDRLYQLPDVARVEFGDYVRTLVADLRRASSSAGAELTVDAEELHLPIEIAMPLGQILCELLTNVIKYAFGEGEGGRALVSIRRLDARGRLVVADEGVGLPDGFDPEQSGSFGWLLIRSLVRQIDGEVHIGPNLDAGRGVRVEVGFPWPA